MLKRANVRAVRGSSKLGRRTFAQPCDCAKCGKIQWPLSVGNSLDVPSLYGCHLRHIIVESGFGMPARIYLRGRITYMLRLRVGWLRPELCRCKISAEVSVRSFHWEQLAPGARASTGKRWWCISTYQGDHAQSSKWGRAHSRGNTRLTVLNFCSWPCGWHRMYKPTPM